MTVKDISSVSRRSKPLPYYQNLKESLGTLPEYFYSFPFLLRSYRIPTEVLGRFVRKKESFLIKDPNFNASLHMETFKSLHIFG